MLFSVILPIYNVEKYLGECVDSVLAQTFKDYELILVDDGAKDSSPEICDRYAKENDCIKVIHKPNGGLSSARNAGTEVATGDYIVYLDSDDYFANNDFLERLAEKCKKEYDIILYKFSKYYEDTKRFEPCTYSLSGISEGGNCADIINQLAKADAFYCSAWSKTIKRSIIADNNITFKEGLLGEDIEWYYHLLKHVESIGIIDNPEIIYRQREGSIAQTGGKKNFDDNLGTLEYWNEHLKECEDESLRSALYNSMGKLVSNLLISYSRAGKWRKQYTKRTKSLMHIVKNSNNPRTEKIAKVYGIVGFSATVLMLRVLDKIKH